MPSARRRPHCHTPCLDGGMQLDRIAAELRATVGALDARRVDGRDALRLVRVAAEIANLATTAAALLAQRCVDTGTWSTDRKARVPAVTPAEWLADVTDTRITTAKDALAVTQQLHEGSATDRTLRAGELSLTLAREVTAAAEMGRRRQALTRHARHPRRDPVRQRAGDGPRGAGRCGCTGERQAPRPGQDPEPCGRPHRCHPLARWRRGRRRRPVRDPRTRTGPRGARALGGRRRDLSILVEDGRDVRTFARPGRKVTAALAQLLAARDPVCTITGCGRAARIEGDHNRPVSEGGESSAENLDGLSTQHHRRKTGGWNVVDHADGQRTMEPPRHDRQPAAA